MNEYIATFYTHAGAIVSSRSLTRAGVANRMMPVPRKLSSSCGTCVRYQSAHPRSDLMDRELEAAYRVDPDGGYVKLEAETEL